MPSWRVLSVALAVCAMFVPATVVPAQGWRDELPPPNARSRRLVFFPPCGESLLIGGNCLRDLLWAWDGREWRRT